MSDLISRQAVLDLIKEHNNSFADVFKTHNAGDYLIGEVKELPSVNAEPRTGHWIKSKDGYHRCDKCGSRGSAIKARFCHHCGARMEEKK